MGEGFSTLILGVGFLLYAFLNYFRLSDRLHKKFGSKRGYDIWLRRRSLPQLVIGIGGIIAFIGKRNASFPGYIGVWIATLGIIALAIIDFRFKKQQD